MASRVSHVYHNNGIWSSLCKSKHTLTDSQGDVCRNVHVDGREGQKRGTDEAFRISGCQ